MSWLSSVFHKVNVQSVLKTLGVSSGSPASDALTQVLLSALPTVIEDILKGLGGTPAGPVTLSAAESEMIQQAKTMGVADIGRASDLTDDQIRAVCAETGGNAAAAIAARPAFLQAESAFLAPLLGA